MNEPRSQVPKPRLGRPVLIAALLGVGAGLAAVYGMGGLQRNGTPVQADAGCEGAVEAARRLKPLVHGEIAALTLSETPAAYPIFPSGTARESPFGLPIFADGAFS